MLNLVEPLGPQVETGQGMVQQHPVTAKPAYANQAVVGQFCPGDGFTVRQLVVPAAGQDEMFLYQGDELDVRVLAAHHVDAEIGFTAQYGFEPVVGTEVQQTNADLGVLLVVVTDHRRQEIERCSRNTGEGYLTGLSFCEFANAQDRVFEVIQQAPGLGQEVTPDAGQADATSSAFQQRGAQAFLELLDPSAQGGLGQVQRFCGFVEAAEFGDFHERSYVLQLIFHLGSLLALGSVLMLKSEQ
ncbi:hypothetical protein D3C79_580670 [compost metagenome]